MKCKRCGCNYDDSFAFCPNCGNKSEPNENINKPTMVTDTTKIHISTVKINDFKLMEQIRKPLKTYVVLRLCISMVAIILALCVAFVPFIYTSIPLDGSDRVVLQSFSLFEALLQVIDTLKKGMLTTLVSDIYLIMLMVILLGLIISAVVTIIFCIMHLLELDEYLTLTYDNTIHHLESGKRKKSSIESLIISFIIFLVFYFVFDRLPYIGTNQIDGVNWAAIIPIILLVSTIVLLIIAKVIKFKNQTMLRKAQYKK